ncbi:hypothetical protein [Methylobacterium sp. 1030]|uniref:hypothetical protein n=1 Tax=Methylobacterium sp. 1030 TaxID=3156404 RepID=UPI003397346A
MKESDIESFETIICIAQQIALLKIPMNGSCAVPLGIVNPKNIDLIAWSFVGFSDQIVTDPSCFLVLGCQDEGALLDLSSMTLRTHIGNRRIALSSKSAPLSRADTLIIARAVVSTLGRGCLPHFGALIPLLRVGLDDILANGTASDLRVKRGDSVDTWLAHRVDFVPDCVIVRSPDGYAYSDITSVRLNDPHRAVMTLVADIPLNTQRADGAILSGNGRYVAARVIGAL